MKRIFITYGDEGYGAAKEKIVYGAERTGEFDEILSFGPSNLSPELKASEIIKVRRGGGLWSWKPDVIFSTMSKYKDGDIIVYCDAGCTLYPSPEWNCYWKKLEKADIVAQRLYQRTDRWTRKELLDFFSSNGNVWLKEYQFLATTVILKISDFTRLLIKEWRDIMLTHPELAYDVPKKEKPTQQRGFIENMHDQAIFSALIYKYLSRPEAKKRIYTQWEHIEDYDSFSKQAIRATRLRNGEAERKRDKLMARIKRVAKDCIYKPFFSIRHEMNMIYESVVSL